MKLIAYGSRYFNNSWNIFDFVIAIICLIGIMMYYTIGFIGASAATGIRSFRLLRLLQVFRKQKSLRIIFETFITSLPALLNVGALLFLLLSMFAIISMNLFSEVLLNGPLTPNLNF